METKGRNKHRGAILEAAVKASGVNITQMVKRMGLSRGSYYNHRNDPQLSFEILMQYGKAIKHDFSQDIPQMRQYSMEEQEPPYGPPKTIGEAIEQRDYWRERYYQLLERYHRLSEKG